MSFDQFVKSLQAPALVEIANHWNAVRTTRKMPGWRDIDPAAIRRNLAIIWAWRYDSEQATLVGRLAGQAIVDAIGPKYVGSGLMIASRQTRWTSSANVSAL